MMHSSSLPAIAVIGLACRYPDAVNPRALWEIVLARRRQFRRLPDCRLPLADYYDADKKASDKTYGRQAAVIDGFEFDWAARRIPFSTVQTTDIVHWLALETSLAAVSDAGYTKATLPGERSGVIVGNTLTGEQTRANTMRLRWPFVRRALVAAARTQGMNDEQIERFARLLKDRYTAAFPPVDEDTLAGGLSNTIAGRICNQLNLMGGGFTVDGACASSLLAVAHAAGRIADGDLDVAIAGGVDISLDPFELIGFAKAGALTDGDMTVYDRDGKGFIPGEGCGFVVLKALEAARRDGNAVYAVIHGWGISSDGGGTGITAPSAAGQALALERAYQHAPYGIMDLDFIEGHGTGTTVGDRTELEAIARVQGRTPVASDGLRPCGITSLKSILGHTKAASGIGGLIKAIIAVNRRIIPPTAACRHPHQSFDSAARRLYPVRLGRRRPADEPLRAGVSSMGFGGINCHVTVASGDAPDQRLDPTLAEEVLMAHAQEDEVLVIGADDLAHLRSGVDRLIQTADGISIAELADLAADLSRRVPPTPRIRAAVVAGHPDALTDRLKGLAEMLAKADAWPAGGGIIAAGPDLWVGAGETPGRIGFLFPGQGAQQINMARTLVQRFGWARSLVDRADHIVHAVTGACVSPLIYRDTDRASGPEARMRWVDSLSRTEHAQPAICLANLLWLEFFLRLGIRPAAVGGHSLGELNAFHAAGLFDTDALLGFAARRGQVMGAGQASGGAMAGLRCAESAARRLADQVDGYLVVANRNSPRQTVVSGESEAVDAVLRLARQNGVGGRRLKVSGAFHSRLCTDAADRINAMPMLAQPMGAPRCQVFSSMAGGPLDAGPTMNDHFSRQVRSPVDFIGMVERMADQCDLLIELGPGRILTGLVGDIRGERGPACLPVESRSAASTDLNRTLAALVAHGVPIAWAAVFENRLIRPFVAAAEKVFVVNPCETLPPGEEPTIAQTTPPSAGSLPTVLSEAFSGLPEGLVSRYLEARGGFLNQVVQADLTHWHPDATTARGGLSTPAAPPERARTELYRLVADVTGFDPQTLSGGSRLLDDLNLDSIKAGDLVARFAERCGIAFPDPALLANATLDELADAAGRLVGGAGDTVADSTPDRAAWGRRLQVLVAEMTGFPESSIDPSMRLLDDLNLDSIKAGDLVARLAGEAGASGRVEAAALANARLDQIVDAITGGLTAVTDAPAAPDALTVLLTAASRLTGFSDDALDPDLPVESDLHLGPDKLQTLIKQASAALGIQAQVDIGPLLSRTLRQIGAILNRMVGEQRGSARRPVAFAAQPGWVRDFFVEPAVTPYPRFPDNWRRRSEDDWQQARVLILAGADARDDGETLEAHLLQRGAAVHRCQLDAEDIGDQVQDASFSHLLAILPRNGMEENDRGLLLRRMIRMRSVVVAPPPAAAAPRRRTTVAWIQFGGGFFGRHPRFARLDRCAALALAASVHLERTDLRIRVVDFCPTLSAEVVAWETIAELTTPDSFAAVGYDLDRTRRTLMPQLAHPSTYPPCGTSWSSDDVVLATGGARGITALCALAVAQDTGVRMALVGRTAHPDRSPGTSASREVRSVLDRYADLGLTAAYFDCDVSDGDAVARMLAAVEAQMGPVTGIIHGAGLNRPRQTGRVDPQQAFDETAPKVLGLLHLLDALGDRPPKVVIGMGSIIGITGMPGNGWYGFSNEVMDIALRGFAADHPETRTLVVAYSIWRDEGMGARMGSVELLRDRGIDAIPTQAGVERLCRLFRHDPGHRQVVVTARLGGLDTWHQPLPEQPRGMRFLEKVLQFTPGVEAVFSARLSLDRDRYLHDHQFQDSYLFPTVFGLEAMVQAALALTGRQMPSSLQVRDVKLSRPITVDPETGAEIIVRAIQAETGDGEPTVVNAGVVKSGSGATGDFFSATLVFDGPGDLPAEPLTRPVTPLPLNPQTDLYRSSLLFQGERFQGIETIWEIRASGDKRGSALLTSRPTPAAGRASAAFGTDDSGSLCLGDPFFIDTLLQSAALLVPQDTSLPVAVDRMDLYAPCFQAKEPATVQVTLTAQAGRDLIYRVAAVGANGEVWAKLDGYRLRILQHHDDYPSVADLVAPGERDRRLVAAALGDACRTLGVSAPHVDVACIPGIHRMTKPARHAAETPLIERTLSAAARRCGLDRLPWRIHWRADGKPTAADVDAATMDIALTHEDRSCLCACGPGPLGCDLAAVTSRSREEWRGLLGAARMATVDRFMAHGDALDEAGTRTWAALEALTKAGGDANADLRIVRQMDDALLLAASDVKGATVQLLTRRIRLTWGPPRILAITVAEKAVARVPEHLLSADYPGYEPLYDTRPFEMIEGGPQGQLVFVQRLPVTFQPSANLSRTIYFANFIKWMGHTREASAWPVLAQMSAQFAGGRWGGVTNYGHLNILGEGRTSDRIEILMWVSDNSGPQNSTMTLSYDFRKMLPDGEYERLAFCRLQTTWVEILGPGVARVAPYPAYYGQFIEDMCPRFDAPDVPAPMPESLGHLVAGDDDPVVYQAPAGPMVRPVVREQTFDTTLAHANLVGNIYYAHYYDWQGQIRDRFFYELIPGHYHGIGEQGELLALESRVDHLREAMPFDRLVLTLAVKELRSCRVTFHLDYFRVDPDGSRLKIAHGLHHAVWTRRDRQGRPTAAPFPDAVRSAFGAAISAVA